MSSRPCCRHGSVFAPISCLKGLLTHHCPKKVSIAQYELPCMLQQAPCSSAFTALPSQCTFKKASHTPVPLFKHVCASRLVDMACEASSMHAYMLSRPCPSSPRAPVTAPCAGTPGGRHGQSRQRRGRRGHGRERLGSLLRLGHNRHRAQRAGERV